MRIKFNQSKGHRIYHTTFKDKTANGRTKRFNIFIGVCNHNELVWLETSKKWVSWDEAIENDEDYSTHFDGANSYKAFIRRLRQWGKYLPKKTEFKLISYFKDCDITGII